MQWVISQAPRDQAEWPDSVPTRLAAAATCDAAMLIDELSKAVRFEDGKVVVPQWAEFQAAAHLLHIFEHGFRSNEN